MLQVMSIELVSLCHNQMQATESLNVNDSDRGQLIEVLASVVMQFCLLVV